MIANDSESSEKSEGAPPNVRITFTCGMFPVEFCDPKTNAEASGNLRRAVQRAHGKHGYLHNQCRIKSDSPI